jgi:hypothetical protein
MSQGRDRQRQSVASSSRATFPFKPASTLIELQNSKPKPRPVMMLESKDDKSVIVMIDEDDSPHSTKAESESDSTRVADNIRKTTVAITGGAIVGAGLILIPFPIIPGIPFVYGGMMLLATEFEPARDVLEKMKEPIAKWLADDDVKDDEHVNNVTTTAGDVELDETNNIIDELKKMSVVDGGHDRTKSMKHWLRKVLSIDSDDADHTTHSSTCRSNEPHRTKSSQNITLNPLSDQQEMSRSRIIYRHSSSDGSITLNALDQGSISKHPLEQNRLHSSHGRNESECFWVPFHCNPFQDEKY